MFKLIDKAEACQPGKSYSEDAFLVTPSLVAICDGATGKSDRRILSDYDSDAMWLSNVFLKNLKTAEQTRTDNDWKKLARRAMALTLQDFEAAGADRSGKQKYELPNSTLVMAMRHVDNPARMTLVNVSDGILIYPEDGRIKRLGGSPVLREIEQKREEKLIRMIKAGQPFSREKDFLPAMRENINAINTPAGFASLDLSYDWLSHPDVRTIETVQEQDGRLLLATDGMTRLFDLYKQGDYISFYNKAMTQGLESLVREVRNIEARDAACTQYPRLKKSDDICALIC